MITVIINASDLAACIGRNPYKSVDDMLKEYYKKFFLKQGETEPMTKRKRAEDAFNGIKVSNPELYEQCIKVMHETPLKSADDVTKYADELGKVLKKDGEVSDFVRSAIYTRFGTEQEDKTLVSMHDNPKKTDEFVKKLLFCDGKFNVYVGGRCDGLVVDQVTGEKKIVEIKNRIRRFFNRVPEYERVQLMAYLYVNNIDHGELVERFREDMKRYPVEFEPGFWDCVIEDSKRFFEALLSMTTDTCAC